MCVVPVIRREMQPARVPKNVGSVPRMDAEKPRDNAKLQAVSVQDKRRRPMAREEGRI